MKHALTWPLAMDFNNAPNGEGREKHHIAAIKAAQVAGVKHIYYTSLAFGSNSKSGVMRAHLRTEAFLRSLKDIKYTIIREGLYNESWPLYLGYYDLNKDDRNEIILAGDGPVSWTSISDLGLGTALVIAENSEKYAGQTFYLSSEESARLEEIAQLVSTVKGKEIVPMIVSPEQYVEYYRQRGREKSSVEWWSSSYAALKADECHIQESMLNTLLASRGRKAKPIEQTVKEMLSMKKSDVA